MCNRLPVEPPSRICVLSVEIRFRVLHGTLETVSMLVLLRHIVVVVAAAAVGDPPQPRRRTAQSANSSSEETKSETKSSSSSGSARRGKKIVIRARLVSCWLTQFVNEKGFYEIGDAAIFRCVVVPRMTCPGVW
eukprot:scaffold401_cov152-Amphora_coffeaeformis.AAC.2